MGVALATDSLSDKAAGELTDALGGAVFDWAVLARGRNGHRSYMAALAMDRRERPRWPQVSQLGGRVCPLEQGVPLVVVGYDVDMWSLRARVARRTTRRRKECVDLRAPQRVV